MSLFDSLRRFTYVSAGDWVTLANGVAGLLALTYILDDNRQGYAIAVGLLVVAVVADGLDGAFARHFGSKHHYGIYLDSVADTVSFCLAPAALIYMLFYDPSRGPALDLIDNWAWSPSFDLYNFAALSAALLVGVLGMLRLARFSLRKEDVRPNFSGLPTPSMTLFVLPLALLATPHTNLDLATGAPPLAFEVGVTSLLASAALAAVAFLMVTEQPYPKPKGRFGLAVLVSLVLLAVGALLFGLDDELARAPLALVLGLMAVYVVGGPLISKRYFGKVTQPPQDRA